MFCSSGIQSHNAVTLSFSKLYYGILQLTLTALNWSMLDNFIILGPDVEDAAADYSSMYMLNMFPGNVHEQ